MLGRIQGTPGWEDDPLWEKYGQKCRWRRGKSGFPPPDVNRAADKNGGVGIISIAR